MKSLHRTSTAQESLNGSAVNRRTLLGAALGLAVPHYWRLVVRRVRVRLLRRQLLLHLLLPQLLLPLRRRALRRLASPLPPESPPRQPPPPPLLRALRRLLAPQARQRSLPLSRVLSLSRTRCGAS